eukprot:SAG31_NODE_6927_length_1847_cov_1.246568_2_plen_291_part_01
MHSCVENTTGDVDGLLRKPEFQRHLPRLLIERNCNGATPFFSAMAKGDLVAANAIRSKVEQLKKTEPSLGQALVAPDIFGTPPLQAMIRVCGLALNQPLPKRQSRQIFTEFCFEVCGAGSKDANGLYHPVIRSSYKGPTLYHKAVGNMYMFRWKREQWIIGSGADFQDSRPRSAKLYSVPSGSPPSDLPPETRWTITSGVCGIEPAPHIHRHKNLIGLILNSSELAMGRDPNGETALETCIKIIASQTNSSKASQREIHVTALQQLEDICRALCEHPGVVLGCFSKPGAAH